VTTLLAVTAGLLAACGAYLLLGRQLSRIIIGIGLLGHSVNILLVLSGGDGGDPAFAGGDAERFADPLPQALVLTAIVITFGVIAFLLALAYRSWQIEGDDEVEDDVEDRRIAREALHDAEIEATS
jgi:multicomponent Na+:H+ antiporter subunit C